MDDTPCLDTSFHDHEMDVDDNPEEQIERYYTSRLRQMRETPGPSRITARIWDDLRSRKGMRAVLDNIDPGTKLEILETWLMIVEGAGR